ncbi:hypothetical protein Trydic_g22799 [Trypoxylus dichotomus]
MLCEIRVRPILTYVSPAWFATAPRHFTTVATLRIFSSEEDLTEQEILREISSDSPSIQTVITQKTSGTTKYRAATQSLGRL